MPQDTQTTVTPPVTTPPETSPPAPRVNPTRRFTYDQLDPYHKAIADRVANTLRVYNRILETNDPEERQSLIDWAEGKVLTPEQRSHLGQDMRTSTENVPIIGGLFRVHNAAGDVSSGVDGFISTVRRGWNRMFGHRITPEEARQIGTAYASALQSQSFDRPRADHYFEGLTSRDCWQYGIAGLAWGVDWLRTSVASWTWLQDIPWVGPKLHELAQWLGSFGPMRTLQEHIDRNMASYDAQPVADAMSRAGRIGGVDGRELANAITNGFIGTNAQGQDVAVPPTTQEGEQQPEVVNNDGTLPSAGTGNGVLERGGQIGLRTTGKILVRMGLKGLHLVPILGLGAAYLELNYTGADNADVVDGGRRMNYREQLDYDHEHGRIDDLTYARFLGYQGAYFGSGLLGLVEMIPAEGVQMVIENADERALFMRYLPPSVVATLTGDTVAISGEELASRNNQPSGQPTQPPQGVNVDRRQLGTLPPAPAPAAPASQGGLLGNFFSTAQI